MNVTLLLATNAALLVALFILLWLICLKTRDVTPIDSVWALGMVFLAAASFLQTGGDPTRKALLLGLCAAWGLRLGLYLLWRWRTHGPDRRYGKMFATVEEAKGWGFGRASLLLVFATQAPLLFIVCLPVQLGMIDAAPPAGPAAIAGAAIAVAGILFESIGDWQLVRFRRDPANAGTESWSGMWALPGPVLLTWTLTRWSGVPTIEGRLKRKRAGYQDYVRRTSGFVPWWPKA
jgi:steroid 5-alpha reductase family enzyme